MTSKAALAKALLDGKIVNIKNGFHLFGITNIPREIGRSIERDGKVTKNPNDSGFGVEVTRTEMDGETRYGQPCCWVDYRLHRTEANQEGIKKMKDYVAQEMTEYLKELREGNKKIPDELKDGVEKYLQPELF